MMKRRPSAVLLVLGTALSGSVLSGRAHADASDLEAALNETVITTASSNAERGSSAPATSTIVTAEQLEIYGIRFLNEAINYLAMGVVTSDPLRTVDIGARGVLLPGDNGKHFLLLIDGHAINDPMLGAARFDVGAGIPIQAIDHIEVILGPGSVLYGSHAMMGVINVITKRAKSLDGSSVIAEYEPARSYRAGLQSGYEFELFGQRGEATLALDYYRRFGPDLEFEKQPFWFDLGIGGPRPFERGKPVTGIYGGTVADAYFTEAPSAVLRVRWGDWEASAKASMYKRGIPYSDLLNLVDFDDPESYELDRALNTQLKYESVLSSMLQVSARVYADGFDYQRRMNRWAQLCYVSTVPTCQRYTAARAHWVGVEPRLNVDWFEDSGFVTTVGVDARMRWVSGKEDTLDFDSGRPLANSAGVIEGRAAVVAPYVQQVWSPAHALELSAGARLDADERTEPIVSPRVAVATRPWREGTLKAIYSQAFRAPVWVETSPAGSRQLRSPDVESEFVRSAELTLEQRVGSHRLLYGLFRSWWTDLVEPHTLSIAERDAAEARGELPLGQFDGIFRYQNVARIENWGYNASYEGSLLDEQLLFGLNATAAYTRWHGEGRTHRLPAAPQLFGNARVAYRLNDPLPTLALAASYLHERPVTRAFDSGFSPAPYAPPELTLRATISGPVPGLRALSYRLSGSYSFASEGPYVVGPYQRAWEGVNSPYLNPVDRLNGFVGLRYAFDAEQEPQP